MLDLYINTDQISMMMMTLLFLCDIFYLFSVQKLAFALLQMTDMSKCERISVQ